jgi:hypothetical protein
VTLDLVEEILRATLIQELISAKGITLGANSGSSSSTSARLAIRIQIHGFRVIDLHRGRARLLNIFAWDGTVITRSVLGGV